MQCGSPWCFLLLGPGHHHNSITSSGPFGSHSFLRPQGRARGSEVVQKGPWVRPNTALTPWRARNNETFIIPFHQLSSCRFINSISLERISLHTYTATVINHGHRGC
jgi:hypothetical protein